MTGARRIAGRVRDAELALLNAPFEEDGWRRAVAAVIEASDCDAASMVALGGPLLIPLNFFVGHNAERAQEMFQAPELWGACNWRVNTVTTAMAIQHDPDYAAYRALFPTDPYDDAMLDLDFGSGCQSAVMMEEGGFLGLALARTIRRGPLGAEQLHNFAYLRICLQRAVRMQLALDGQDARDLLESGRFGDQATMLLDGHGRICALSDEAVELLGNGAPIRLRDAFLRLDRRDEDERLHRVLAHMLGATDDVLGPHVHRSAIRGTADEGEPGWSLSLVRLPRRDHGLGFDARVAVTVSRL